MNNSSFKVHHQHQFQLFSNYSPMSKKCILINVDKCPLKLWAVTFISLVSAKFAILIDSCNPFQITSIETVVHTSIFYKRFILPQSIKVLTGSYRNIYSIFDITESVDHMNQFLPRKIINFNFINSYITFRLKIKIKSKAIFISSPNSF